MIRHLITGLHLSLFGGIFGLLAVRAAFAHGSAPQDTPVDRLVQNLNQYIKEHPDDPEGYYRLGRVHTLALESKTGFVPAWGRGEKALAEPAEGSWAKNQNRDKRAEKATVAELKTHLEQAIENLNKAITIDPLAARYRLTLACALEAGRNMAGDIEAWPLCPSPPRAEWKNARVREYKDEARSRIESIPKKPGVLDEVLAGIRKYDWRGPIRDEIVLACYKRRNEPEFKDALTKIRLADWSEQIEEQFFTAMCYSLPWDGKAEEKPIWGGMENWTSYEAARDFVRVVGARESRASDFIRLRVAQATVKAFDDLPRPNAITPIVIDLTGRTHIAELESTSTVKFDLDGTGRSQSWRWLKPDVGILAWDPRRTGAITSGHQLFGSVSWWLFFTDGYEALDLLDNDRDGELTGPELEGLSVWFDRNSNGASDADELELVSRLGIASISCRATGRQGRSPVNLEGLRLSDGRCLPTFDWIATSPDAQP